MSQPDVIIHRCAPGDEAALALVGVATFLESYSGIIDGGDIVAHCGRQHSADKYRAWLAEPDTAIWLAGVAPGDAPVGYLVLTKPDLPLPTLSAGDAEVKRIYVLGKFQGRQLGRQLMETAVAHAKAAGKSRLLLGVYGENRAALAFYGRLGFTKVGVRQFQVGSRTYDDLILGLNL